MAFVIIASDIRSFLDIGSFVRVPNAYFVTTEEVGYSDHLGERPKSVTAREWLICVTVSN